MTISLACEGIAAILSVDPAADFPDTIINTTFENLSVDLINNQSSTPITVTSITIDQSVFTLDNPPVTPFTLVGNGRQTLTIDFTPVAAQSYSGSLLVVTQNQGNHPFPVTGLGVPAQIAVVTEPDPLPINPFDFGNVRAGETLAQGFLVQNNSSAPIDVLTITSDDARFQVAAPGSATTIQPGNDLAFSVEAQPATAGQVNGTISVMTNVPGGDISFPVQVIGVAAEIALGAPTLDFGGVDLQLGAAQTQTVTLTNSGTATLEISDLQITGSSRFTLAAGQETSAAVAVGDPFDVMVEYLPTVEAMPDTATLEIVSDAFTEPMAQIQLSGRGIDRHIDVSALEVSFPDTYRNPIEPSRQTLTVMNTGEATLRLTMLSAGGMAAQAFSIQAPEPMEVAGQSSQDIVIEFSPDSVSPNFQGLLTIVNDDDDQPMVEVRLVGNGVGREVNFGPGPITLRTGVNVPIRLSDLSLEAPQLLQLVNVNANDTYTVSELRIADMAGQSHRRWPVPGRRLRALIPSSAVGETLDIDIEFNAHRGRPGSRPASRSCSTPTPRCDTRLCEIEGQAFDVELRGGGCGCDVWLECWPRRSLWRALWPAWILVFVALLFACVGDGVRRRCSARGAATVPVVA